MKFRIRSKFVSQFVVFACFVFVIQAFSGCTTLPTRKYPKRVNFPPNAYFKKPMRPYRVVGEVKSQIDYDFMNPDHNAKRLCRNSFNSAVRGLLKNARKNGGDAVMDVRSVVFLMDGKIELYPRAECTDEGATGQVLARGTAIQWLKSPTEALKTKNH